jgi:hypothetical protein
MGLEYCCTAFIGRVCTEEESERCYNAMKYLNPDEIGDRLFSIEYAGPESIFKSDDELPIVAHNFNHCMATNLELLSFQYEKNDFVFYVVQKEIITTSNRGDHLIPVLLNSLPVPKDERYGLLMVHYIQ